MSASDIAYRPTCQGRTANDCSNCSMAYDCVRARSGRSFAWGAVAIGAVVVFGGIAQLFVGG